ncbi:MAG: hypothetical protein ACP5NW_00070 [Candidatus Woesearchaeota archaeon]
MNDQYKKYTITDSDKNRITREDFENFLKAYFPEHIIHGLVKCPLEHTFLRSYDIIENRIGIGKLNLTYGEKETEIEIIGRHIDRLLTELKEKNGFQWAEKHRHFLRL